MCSSKCAIKYRRPYWFSLGVLLTGTLLRFLYLDSDPHYYEWIGYVTDEGRWVQHARNWVLHGTLVDSASINFHLFMAPLFELSNYLVFKLLGVSIFASRLFTALSGSLMIALFWGRLRRAVTPQALLVGVALLALQSDLVGLSRVAVPEMVVMSLELAIYFLIVLGRSPWHMAAAGVLLMMACGMKATTALMVPIFSVIVFAMPRRAIEARRWRDLNLFLTGFLATGTIGGGIGYFLIPDLISNLSDNIGDITTLIQNFLGVPKLFLYNIVSFPFEHALAYTFNLWALGVWLTVVVWWASAAKEIEFRLHTYLVTSGIWFLLYFILMLSLEYFPTRYKIHILIPMALFITFGTSLIQKVGMVEVIRSFAGAKGRCGLLWLSALSVPTAAFLSPLLTSVSGLVGIDSQRLSIKLFCFLSLLVIVTYGAEKVKRNQRAISFLLVFPLIEGMVWLVLPMLEYVPSFWPTVGFGMHAAYFSLEIFIAITLSFILLKAIDESQCPEGSWVITAVAIFYLAVSLVRIAPDYFDRQYSIRDSSRDLGLLLPASARIATFKAETLFNNNNLRYRSRYKSFGWPAQKPDFLLVTFDYTELKDILAEQYHFIKRYNLWILPQYDRLGSSSVEYVNESLIVVLYKKNEKEQVTQGDEHGTRASALMGMRGTPQAVHGRFPMSLSSDLKPPQWTRTL